ncbi:MAG: NADH-quinone oxidoreductase subunit N [Nitrospirota bacterium]
MTKTDIILLLPLMIVGGTSVVIMLILAFFRNHALTAGLAIMGFALAAASIPMIAPLSPRNVTTLIVIDPYALFYMGLIFISGMAVAALSFPYLEMHEEHREEYYLLILVATLGAAVLVASTHFVSFFLGIEMLSVSLYALASYIRHSDKCIEAGVKYLILAAVSSAFILFGMALIYAEIGSMDFARIAARISATGVHGLTLFAGLGMIIVGMGFKLAVVPFHLWTPDVYEGAPAPVSAFIATISKGAVFALLLRYFSKLNIHAQPRIIVMITIIAIASMFVGNLLALLQTNVKRILAYSSISHLGYLLITLIASGPTAVTAATFYITAYMITMLGAFGVVSILSRPERDADQIEDYQGLAYQRPWLAGIFTVMLFSLAGIPLTAGFIGKFYVVAAGVNSGLIALIIILVINSIIGLFYYLRIIIALYSAPREAEAIRVGKTISGHAVLAGLLIVLIWFGVYPGPLIAVIQKTIQSIL